MRAILLAAGLMLAGAAPAAAHSVEGEWLTQNKGGKVHIAPCPARAERICGAISWLKDPTKPRDVNNPDPALRTRPILGLTMIRDFKPAGPDRWTGGKIYDPRSGKTYDSKMSLNANGSLKVEGCVLMVCQAQTWTRD